MKFHTIAFALALSALSASALSATDMPKALINGHEAHPDRVIARFRSNVTVEQKDRLFAALRMETTHEFASVDGLVALEFLPAPRPNAVITPPLDPVAAGKKLERRIRTLMNSKQFVYVEPDYVVRALAEPTDAAYQSGELWGLNNIKAPAAWDTTTGDSSVVVAVIDSGVNYEHQDLASQMWINTDEIAGNGVDDDDDGYVDNIYGINAITNGGDPMDDDSHGSHVAGTIGASANDVGRIVGVAWNVRLMALKFLDSQGSGFLIDAVECIDFARENGADIMNNSWGGGPYVQSLRDAIQETSNAGMLFVAAAGNDGGDNDVFAAYPASYNVDNIISVAAIDRNNELAWFSNYGDQSVHIAAPGVAILSATHTSSTSYSIFNGTSMAAPHVSGAAALLWADANPSSREDMLTLRQQLLSSANPTPSLVGLTTTEGRLDVDLALRIPPDGILELAVKSDSGTTVFAGRNARILVEVSDLLPVANATVTATTDFGGGTISFSNNGAFPDAVANDSTYSASVAIPSGVDAVTLQVNASAPGKSPAVETVVFAVAETPDNDLFAGSEEILITPASITASNLDATGEPNEPYHFKGSTGLRNQRSLWWTWTAPHTRPYSLSTAGSDFDTVMAIYQGAAIDSLFPVADNDDGSFDWTSLITFFAIKNTTYYFVVDGYPYDVGIGQPLEADAGGVEFNFWQNNPMLNNDFEDRTPLTGVNLSLSSHNMGSTEEPNEPAHDPDFSTFSSVWWSWTPDNSGPVWISTAGSSIDSVLAVYQGTSLTSLQLVAANNDASYPNSLTSEVSFFATAGQTYQIVVDGINSAEGIARGLIDLHISDTPPNDSFANAITLNGEYVQAEAYTMGATFEPDEPSPTFNFSGRSVWWKWTAPRSGNATVTTDGSNFDTVLGVYTGDAINNLTEIASNNDRVEFAIRTSLLTFAAQAGTTYYIQLDGWEPVFDPTLAGYATLTLTMDGRSILAQPTFQNDGSTTVDLLGEPNRIYVLESSPDLRGWSGVATNTVVSRKLRFKEPTQSGVQPRFYRARPATLIE